MATHGYFFLLILGSFIYAVSEDFTPTAQTSSIGLYIAAAFTCVYFIFTFDAITSVHRAKFKKTSRQVRFTSTLVFYAFILFLFWVTACHTIPAVYTRLVGNDYTIDIGVAVTNKYKKNSCRYRIEGELIKNAFPAHICISKSMYETKKNKYRLSGLSSNLGVLIKNATPI
ncbi:hypothetical protein [Marinobacterium lacunae]|uniref:hypothetical protein n=1 Tax=Marinobacterium lacunae TaxID=1232683 RepID=UPI0012DFC4BF|nr:hypothetical protein [Marinobacterium lacunae]